MLSGKVINPFRLLPDKSLGMVAMMMRYCIAFGREVTHRWIIFFLNCVRSRFPTRPQLFKTLCDPNNLSVRLGVGRRGGRYTVCKCRLCCWFYQPSCTVFYSHFPTHSNCHWTVPHVLLGIYEVIALTGIRNTDIVPVQLPKSQSCKLLFLGHASLSWSTLHCIRTGKFQLFTQSRRRQSKE